MLVNYDLHRIMIIPKQFSQAVAYKYLSLASFQFVCSVTLETWLGVTYKGKIYNRSPYTFCDLELLVSHCTNYLSRLVCR